MMLYEYLALMAFITMLLGVGLLSLGAEKGGLWTVVAGAILGIAAVIVQECCEVTLPTALDVYYYKEPKKMDQCYVGAQCAILARNLFPEVTFENSPMEVELKLIEK